MVTSGMQSLREWFEEVPYLQVCCMHLVGHIYSDSFGSDEVRLSRDRATVHMRRDQVVTIIFPIISRIVHFLS